MATEITVGHPEITINRGKALLRSEPDGSVIVYTDQGFYYRDTRYISSGILRVLFRDQAEHCHLEPPTPIARAPLSTPGGCLGDEDRLAFLAWRCSCVRTQISRQRLPHRPRHLSSLVSSSITPPHSGQMQFKIADLTSSAWLVRVSIILLHVLSRVP
jgi:hypothetical protein